jgi:hypothetical protein
MSENISTEESTFTRAMFEELTKDEPKTPRKLTYEEKVLQDPYLKEEALKVWNALMEDFKTRGSKAVASCVNANVRTNGMTRNPDNIIAYLELANVVEKGLLYETHLPFSGTNSINVYYYTPSISFRKHKIETTPDFTFTPNKSSSICPSSRSAF